MEKADVVIDLRDSLSLFSLLKVSKAFGEMKPREILEVRGSDPSTRKDLFKVLPESAYDILGIKDGMEGGSFYQVRIQKRR